MGGSGRAAFGCSADAAQAVVDEAVSASVGIMYLDFARGKLAKLEQKAKATATLQATLDKAAAMPCAASREQLAKE